MVHGPCETFIADHRGVNRIVRPRVVFNLAEDPNLERPFSACDLESGVLAFDNLMKWRGEDRVVVAWDAGQKKLWSARISW